MHIGPRGRPKVTAGSDHYFRTWCLYVCPSFPTFPNLAKQNHFQARIVNAVGGTVGLAEWIIDDLVLSVPACCYVRLLCLSMCALYVCATGNPFTPGFLFQYLVIIINIINIQTVNKPIEDSILHKKVNVKRKNTLKTLDLIDNFKN